LLVVALALLGTPACLPLGGPRPGPPGAAAAPTYEVERVRDVAYNQGADADPRRHRLDLFLPRGLSDYPVVVLVHGGCWMFGNNSCAGYFSAVGAFLASHGVGAVLPNYRLSPRVKHPEHVKDVARAFAWAHAHVAAYGGRPDRMFLAGHSAGGHLVALLATDETYLKAEGLRTQDVKGVICVCGVYRIPPGKLDVTLGGATPIAFRLDEIAPAVGTFDLGGGPAAAVPGLPLSVNVFGPAFGDDPQVREAASPLSHVRPGLPPFLLFSAERDLPTLTGMAAEFFAALRQQGCEVAWLTAAGRNHNSTFFRAASADDPVAQAMLDFIRHHAAEPGR
jgi:acetyl esterase/lipase